MIRLQVQTMRMILNLDPVDRLSIQEMDTGKQELLIALFENRTLNYAGKCALNKHCFVLLTFARGGRIILEEEYV